MSEQPLCPFCGKPLEWYAPEEIFWCGNIHCVVILESIPKIPKAEQIKRLNRRPLEDALKARIEVLEKQLRTYRLATVKAYTALKNGKPMTAQVALETCQLNVDIGRDAQSRGQREVKE